MTGLVAVALANPTAWQARSAAGGRRDGRPPEATLLLCVGGLLALVLAARAAPPLRAAWPPGARLYVLNDRDRTVTLLERGGGPAAGSLAAFPGAPSQIVAAAGDAYLVPLVPIDRVRGPAPDRPGGRLYTLESVPGPQHAAWALARGEEYAPLRAWHLLGIDPDSLQPETGLPLRRPPDALALSPDGRRTCAPVALGSRPPGTYLYDVDLASGSTRRPAIGSQSAKAGFRSR